MYLILLLSHLIGHLLCEFDLRGWCRLLGGRATVAEPVSEGLVSFLWKRHNKLRKRKIPDLWFSDICSVISSVCSSLPQWVFTSCLAATPPTYHVQYIHYLYMFKPSQPHLTHLTSNFISKLHLTPGILPTLPPSINIANRNVLRADL